MVSRRVPKPRPPLDGPALEELALRYVGRFATTRSKLRTYLQRKLRERGWADGDEPDLERLADRFRDRGYIDDEAYALAKSRSLSNRGYGAARVRQSLRAAGVTEDDQAGARKHAASEAAESALRFARRRRFGPFATETADPKGREKAIAAMIRAGHSFELARKILQFRPGADVQPSDLNDKGGG